MIGRDKSWLKVYDIDAKRIAGLIPFSGQRVPHFTIQKEREIPNSQPIIVNFAPLYNVRPDGPPMLLITGDRELELLDRYEENAYLARMMKLVGYKETKLYELGGYGHNMTEPAFPLLLDAIRQTVQKKKQ